jgi:8-oxo-dGTP pyrophosphatase MutT (NUDIX family)
MKKAKIQVGALATRQKSGRLEVLLVTTRGPRERWIIPKGSRSRRIDDVDAAAREAEEEGGVLGTVEQQPIGKFRHRKRNGAAKEIEVYRLNVEEQKTHWREEKQRKRRWATRKEAKLLVTDPALRRIIDRS